MSEYTDISAILKLIIAEQFNYGLNYSRTSAQTPNLIIDEIRKCLKYIRSLFRLLKPVISEVDFHANNKLIDDTIQELDLQREFYVNFQTFQDIVDQLSILVSKETEVLIAEYLKEGINSAYTNKKNAYNNKIVSIAFQLSKIRDLISNIKTRKYSNDMFLLAIDKNFIKAMTYFNEAKISLHGEEIYKWRRYCEHILFELKYGPIEKNTELDLLINKMDSLTELLRKENNLAVLDKILKKEIYPKINQKEHVVLHQFIEKERNTFQKKAFWLGREVFVKKSVLPFIEIVFANKVQDV